MLWLKKTGEDCLNRRDVATLVAVALRKIDHF